MKENRRLSITKRSLATALALPLLQGRALVSNPHSFVRTRSLHRAGLRCWLLAGPSS
jgi:hypothetical protein